MSLDSNVRKLVLIVVCTDLLRQTPGRLAAAARTDLVSSLSKTFPELVTELRMLAVNDGDIRILDEKWNYSIDVTAQPSPEGVFRRIAAVENGSGRVYTSDWLSTMEWNFVESWCGASGIQLDPSMFATYLKPHLAPTAMTAAGTTLAKAAAPAVTAGAKVAAPLLGAGVKAVITKVTVGAASVSSSWAALAALCVAVPPAAFIGGACIGIAIGGAIILKLEGEQHTKQEALEKPQSSAVLPP